MVSQDPNHVVRFCLDKDSLLLRRREPGANADIDEIPDDKCGFDQ